MTSVSLLPGLIGSNILIKTIDGNPINGRYVSYDEQNKVIGIVASDSINYYIPLTSVITIHKST